MTDIDKKSALGFACAFGICLSAILIFLPKFSNDNDKNNNKPNIIWLVCTVLFSTGLIISFLIFIMSFFLEKNQIKSNNNVNEKR